MVNAESPSAVGHPTTDEPSWDNNARPPHQFRPKTYSQYLSSVFTLWTLLDAVIESVPMAARALTPYGYMKRPQLHAYAALVWNRSTSGRKVQYCETGFNGGHGTAAMLLASPDVFAHSFDIFSTQYSHTASKLLKLHFGSSRFRTYAGNTRSTLPAFVAARQSNFSCDIVLIDGDHSRAGAYRDLVAMSKVAACNATVLIDDINEAPGEALKQAEREGLVEVLYRDMYRRGKKGSTRSPGGSFFPACALKRTHTLICAPTWGWALARFTPRATRSCLRSAAVTPAEQIRVVNASMVRRARDLALTHGVANT